MSSDKVDVEEIPVVFATKPSFWSRVKAHYKKWWWAHLIAVVVVVLVVTLPLVYVGYPNIAQGNINDSTLSVSSMVISNPSPDGFDLNQTQAIGTHSMYHPQIYSFDAEVGLEGASTFATVTVPSVKAHNGAPVDVDQALGLSNVTAFTEFCVAAMLNEEFGLTIYGKPHLKQAGLHTITVKYDKVVSMKGLNKLSGFRILRMQLDSNRTDGNNANGTVLIPNPSVMTLSMGNVTMDLSSNGTSLGQAFLNDLVLVPGNNTVPMLSRLNQSNLLGLLPRSAPYTIPLSIVGNSSVYNGQEIPYFTAALAANTLTLDLNIPEVLGS